MTNLEYYYKVIRKDEFEWVEQRHTFIVTNEHGWRVREHINHEYLRMMLYDESTFYYWLRSNNVDVHDLNAVMSFIQDKNSEDKLGGMI